MILFSFSGPAPGGTVRHLGKQEEGWTDRFPKPDRWTPEAQCHAGEEQKETETGFKKGWWPKTRKGLEHLERLERLERLQTKNPSRFTAGNFAENFGLLSPAGSPSTRRPRKCYSVFSVLTLKQLSQLSVSTQPRFTLFQIRWKVGRLNYLKGYSIEWAIQPK